MSVKHAQKYALAVENIHHSYRDPLSPWNRLVLTNISFQAPKESVVCILGPSGCGKTTLLRIIAGLITPNSGKVWIDGELHTDGRRLVIAAHKRKIGYVFQQPSLFPNMNVFKNVAFPFQRGGKQVPNEYEHYSAAVEDILRRTQLKGLECRSTATLSGGQAQRVALARALVYQPSLLLLDEPLSSLDNALRAELLGLLLDFQKQLDTTMIYVTHDEREALRLATHLLVLDGQGQLLQYATLREVLECPKSAAVALLIGGWNVFEGRLTEETKPCIDFKIGLSMPVPNGLELKGNAVFIGLPMSSVQIRKAGEHLAEQYVSVPVCVSRVGPWYTGWRYECEIEDDQGAHLSVVCFSEKTLYLDVGLSGIACFRREDLHVFEDQRNPIDCGIGTAAEL